MRLRNLIFIGLLLSVFAIQDASAQTNDFFSNTSTANSRFKSSGGANDCATCPGFNPCNGSAIGGTSCDGNGLLRPTLVDSNNNIIQVGFVGPQVCISLCVGTAGNPTNDSKLEVRVSPLFATTGPGAITDNMLGSVADPTRTNAEVQAGVIPFGMGSRVPGKCGNTASDGSFDPTIDSNSTTGSMIGSGLNCGYLRYDPTAQGQKVPTGSNTMDPTQQMTRINTMTLTSSSGATCVLATDPPRANNTGSGCDMINFNAAAHAFTSNVFPTGTDWATGTFTGIPNGLYNEFTFSRGVVCRTDTGDTTCAKQSIVQEIQTENGTSHAEWAFLWSTRSDSSGNPSSVGATCGSPINGVAQTTAAGQVCVHWYSDYEDSPCHIVGTYDPNQGPNTCRGVASGYGILDVTEGYFIYNGDAGAAGQTSYPLGPTASFGNINGATSP